MITKSTFETSAITFELGKEFDEITLDDRHVKSVITMNGNRMVHTQGGVPAATIIRYFGDKYMIAFMKVGKVTAICEYSTDNV